MSKFEKLKGLNVNSLNQEKATTIVGGCGGNAGPYCRRRCRRISDGRGRWYCYTDCCRRNGGC